MAGPCQRTSKCDFRHGGQVAPEGIMKMKFMFNAVLDFRALDIEFLNVVESSFIRGRGLR